jgi:glycosyltransferase involved in cell wall biosynthesis
MKSRLNVLHISPDFNYVCGVSKYVYLILKGLKKFEENGRLRLFFFTNGGDGLERLISIGIEPELMSFRKGLKNVFYFYKNLRHLERFCRNNEINIIHTHHRYPELLANALKSKLNIKTITTVHSLVDGYKRLSFKSDKIIAVSKAVEKNLIEKFGLSKEKIIQIYNPIDFEEYAFNDNVKPDKSLIGLPQNSKVFLFIGRWTRVKGVDILIKAFSELFNIHKELYLILITNIPEKEKSKINRICDRYLFISPQRDISYFYNICDAIILPSRVEPFPYVMLEAGLYKKIFLGADTGGIKEFIINGYNGFLFERSNYISLKETINDVLKLSEENKVFIQSNLYQSILNLYNVSNYSVELLKIYDELNQ